MMQEMVQEWSLQKKIGTKDSDWWIPWPGGRFDANSANKGGRNIMRERTGIQRAIEKKEALRGGERRAQLKKKEICAALTYSTYIIYLRKMHHHGLGQFRKHVTATFVCHDVIRCIANLSTRNRGISFSFTSVLLAASM